MKEDENDELGTMNYEYKENASSNTHNSSLINHNSSFRGWMALIVLVGLALRLWGIGWSLPNAQHPFTTYHPDETINLAAARQVDIPHGQFDTHFYNYGTLYFYLVSFAHTFGRGWHLIQNQDQPPPAEGDGGPADLRMYAPENATLFLAGRLVTVLLGVATIPVVFAIGMRLCGRTAALIAALLYAIAPLAVVHAHFLTVDVPATLFVSLALLWAVRLLDAPTLKNYAVAGIWVGLAAATKYNCVLVIAAPLTALFLNRKVGEKSAVRNFAALLAAVVVAFLVACPGPLLNWDAFWNGTYPGSGVRYELFQHSREGHGTLFLHTGPGWWYHLVISLRFGLGDALLLVGLIALAFAVMRRDRGDRVLLAFFVLYYFAAGLSAVRFARYMIPLFPVWCVFVGRYSAGVPRTNLIRARLTPALVGLAATCTILYTFTLVRAMTLPDARDRAAAFFYRNAPQGASIAFAKIPWFWSPPLAEGIGYGFGSLDSRARAHNAAEVTRFALRVPMQEWDTSVLTPRPDYVVVSNLESMHDLDRLELPAAVAWRNEAVKDRPYTFGPPFIFGPLGDGQLVPEDILYIVPTLEIYTRH